MGNNKSRKARRNMFFWHCFTGDGNDKGYECIIALENTAL
jgi:hypothetical protein